MDKWEFSDVFYGTQIKQMTADFLSISIIAQLKKICGHLLNLRHLRAI